MRTLLASCLAVSLAGCFNESFSKTVNVKTNPDGSSLKTETEERTSNGVKTGSKTETLTEAGGKSTVTRYTIKDGDWVKE